MRRTFFVFPVIRIILFVILHAMLMSGEAVPEDKGTILLPEPQYSSSCSIEYALSQRRSLRVYLAEPLTLAEVSQLLWAAQGITDPVGLRTAPSAGALYPLELYLVVGDVMNLTEGVYRYNPQKHELINILPGDFRARLASAALGQNWVKDGSIVLVFTAVYERTKKKYGQRGIQYVHIEVGNAAQNVYLQAISLQLGTVFVGAFYDDEVREVLKLRENESPLGIMPVGRIPR